MNQYLNFSLASPMGTGFPEKSWIRICGLADNCILEILVYVIMNLK